MPLRKPWTISGFDSRLFHDNQTKRTMANHTINIICPSCGQEYDARLHWLVCPSCGYETDTDEQTLQMTF